MSSYIFINEEIKPKYYVKLISTYYKMIDNLIIKDNKRVSFDEYPKNYIELLKNEKKINCLCFLNELSFYKIDDKYLEFYFEPNLAENIMNVIENEIKEEIDENKNELINKINEDDNEQNREIEILSKKILPKIKFSTEIIKYELNYLLKKKSENEKEQNEKIKNYLKTIFNNIFDLINSIIKNQKLIKEIEKEKEKNINESSNKKRIKGKKEKKKKKEEKKEDDSNKINKIEDIININYLQQYIDLIFYICDIGISLSFRKLVKLSNLMVVDDSRIRNYFISKVHNSLIKLRKSHRNLSRLYSIIFLGLSDPDENIEKSVKEICEIFLDMLKLKLIKYEDHLNNEGYIYIPEVYIFYLIIYFIFNNNLNIYYQSSINNDNKSSKYFMNIFSSYLKAIQKKFGFVDSTFLLKALNEMKKFECKNIKHIRCLDEENVIFNYDENNDEEKPEVDFDKVKNNVIDNIMIIIYNSYLNDNKRTDTEGNLINPQIPNILTGKDIQFKDNYLFNFNKSGNKNLEQNEEEAKGDNRIKSSVIQSSSKKKKKEVKNKRFSFNEYFKEDNEDDDVNYDK